MEEFVELFVVDDHPFYREGVMAMLERVSGVKVVGEAADGFEAIERVLELQPDVVLMDVRIPVWMASRQLVKLWPKAPR